MPIENEDRLRAIESKLDRIQAHIEIGELITRYALAMDARDLDSLIALYSENVRVGAPINGQGHEALRAWFKINTSDSYRSLHAVVGYVIDFTDDDHAQGTVLSYSEHEIGDVWEITGYRALDQYVRENGRWLFLTRRGQPFYRRNVSRPEIELEAPRPDTPRVRLPQEFPTFAPFWRQFSPELVARLTPQPIE